MGGERAKKKWVAPKVAMVNGFPEAWGDCVAGSTPVSTDGGQGCFNGQNTGTNGSHSCGTGGTARGGCTAGNSPV